MSLWLLVFGCDSYGLRMVVMLVGSWGVCHQIVLPFELQLLSRIKKSVLKLIIGSI